MNPIIKRTYILLCLASFLFSLYSTLTGDRFTGGVFLIFCAAVLLMFMMQMNTAVRMNLKRMGDFGATSFSYTTCFGEHDVKSVNNTTDSVFEVKYEDIARFTETRNVILLFPKGGQFLLVFKNQLSAEQLNELKSFLKAKI